MSPTASSASWPGGARSRWTCCAGSCARAAAAGTLRRISAEQFVANMMGLLIFPFAIRLALCELLSLDEAGWRGFLEDRRRILPEFILSGLRP